MDKGLESFFGDEKAKPKGPQDKEERVRVSVRLYNEHGQQTARQRHATLIRRNGARWYIYSGATLLL